MSSAPSDKSPSADRWLEQIVLGGVESTALGVVVTEVDGETLRHVFVNESGAALFGRTRDEFLARAPFDNFSAASHQRLRQLAAEFAKQGHVEPFEGEGVRADGSRFPVEFAIADVKLDGRLFAMGFFRSVEARHAADRALSSSEARYTKLVESAPDGIVISRDGVMLYLNPAAVRLLGYESQDELVGKPMSIFLGAEQIARMVSRLRAVGVGARLEPMEYQARRKDGSPVIAEITSLPFEFGGGPAVIAFARDVTERVRMQEQLARTDRLASLGTLAAGVAHEINNPLTFMALGIELASRRVAASGLSAHEKEQILATLADVSRGADRVALVVRDLKTFSRVAEDEGHPVDVRDVIDSALRIVAHRSKHFAEVVSFVDGLPPVSANAARLEQVFVNLLLNAVQAFEEARAGNRIELRGGLDGERVFIDVEDNGPGISADVTPRIFDPFFTTKPVGEGTGLGLAIVHGILTQMGGDISVTSAVGRGTVFRVTLAVAGRRGEPVTSEVPASDVVVKRARVLIVDDEREVAAVMKRSLDARHDVVALTSPKEALELIASGAELDVIFCDLAMPGISGTELYREAVRTRPELASRFVIVTGGAISGRMQGFLDTWTGPCLEKPFSRRDLEDTLLAVTGGAARAATG